MTSSIVIDCSLLADLLLVPKSVGDRLDGVGVWHAPSLVHYELVSVLRGHLLAGRLQPPQAAQALDDAESLNVRIWPSDVALRERALQLAHNVSAYDAAYVALAEALGCPLATRDRRLAAAAETLTEVWLL